MKTLVINNDKFVATCNRDITVYSKRYDIVAIINYSDSSDIYEVSLIKDDNFTEKINLTYLEISELIGVLVKSNDTEFLTGLLLQYDVFDLFDDFPAFITLITENVKY